MHRRDFTGPFVHTGVSLADGITAMAEVDGPPPSPPSTPAACPAAAENSGCCVWQRASPAEHQSASATPSPASTTATSK